jgi:cell division GTPase FtsZ
MKILVVGLGECGGRIADEFVKLNKRARHQLGIEIVTGAFAVNTDAADLSSLKTIRDDFQHRILIGGRNTGGHGVGKINDLGAAAAREDGDKIIDAMRTAQHFYQTNAFLLIAGVAGGTGSGAMPIVAQMIRERYPEKPIYAMAVLPFAHEEENEERAVYNAATSLKSTYRVVDAVFLIDNQRYIKKDFSLRSNLAAINALIVAPFYHLLCAGEERKQKRIGTKMVDAGDIIQSLSGWTLIGYGKSQLPLFWWFDFFLRNYMKKSAATHRGIQALDQAISELSVKCAPHDARRAIYLISGPAREMSLDLVKQLSDHLKGLSPQAVIRNGDYPREKGLIDITLIMSELLTVDKVRTYYEKATGIINAAKERRGEFRGKLEETDELTKDIPLL